MSKSHDVDFEQFLNLVYDFSPNIFDSAILSEYSSIFNVHDIVEVSDYARIALLKSSVYFQPSAMFNLFLSHRKIIGNPFDRLGDHFDFLLQDLNNFASSLYPNRKIEFFSERLGISYARAFTMSVSSYWLFTKLVPNFHMRNKTPFIIYMSRNIIDFNNTYRIVKK